MKSAVFRLPLIGCPMLASAYLTVGMCRRGKYSLMQTPAGPEKRVNCPLLKAQHTCPLNFLILPLLGQAPLSLHRCQGVKICEARTVASRLQFPTKRFTTSPWHSVSSCSVLSTPMHFLQGMHCAGCARPCATQSLLLNLGNSRRASVPLMVPFMVVLSAFTPKSKNNMVAKGFALSIITESKTCCEAPATNG